MDLASQFGLNLRKTSTTHGGEYTGDCPCCGGRSDGKRTDRFHVWPEQRQGNGTYWCRGCGINGDSIQFVMDVQKVGFKEAARIVDFDLTGKQTSHTGSRSSLGAIPGFTARTNFEHTQTKTIHEPPAVWAEKAGKLVEYAQKHLPGSPGEALLTQKGITHDTAVRCYLGWLPETLYRPRQAWDAPEALKEDGTPKKLWLPSGLVIPLISDDGQRVRRLRIRRQADDDPRYYVVPGSGMAQMILGPKSASRCVCVVESELDAILIHQECHEITRVIAMGNATTKPDHDADVVLNQASRILVSLDNDKPGKSASEWWLKTYSRAHYWPVPAGKDPSDAWQSGVNLRNWLMDGWPEGWRVIAEKKHTDRPDDPPSVSGQKAVSPEPAPVSADPVDELFFLMKRHPKISILNRENRLSIDAYETFKVRYPSDYARLVTLLYQSSEVLDYLEWRGMDRITAGNFFA